MAVVQYSRAETEYRENNCYAIKMCIVEYIENTNYSSSALVFIFRLNTFLPTDYSYKNNDCAIEVRLAATPLYSHFVIDGHFILARTKVFRSRLFPL